MSEDEVSSACGDGVGAEVRPDLTAELTGTELLRWYWLKSELVGLARQLGVSTTGGKLELTRRVVGALDGTGPAPSSTVHGIREAQAGSTGTVGHRTIQLSGELTSDTVVPAGQRSSQVLRRYFEEAIGPGFVFDAALREWLARGGGTLGEAAAFWRDSRAAGSLPACEIAPQFELNRFVRAWHAANPGGTRAAALVAWRDHRSKPVEARDRI